jgi:nucleotidyltransferase/DNA polymerase involved in DNA repair
VFPGISYNEFRTKVASDHRKPSGQDVITPEMGPAFVETLPVGKFHGTVTSAEMNSPRIHSPTLLALASMVYRTCRGQRISVANVGVRADQ